MEILFLGTAAGTPSLQRNVTAIALKLYEERGSFWLFDCGEATQHQIMKSSIRLSKLEKLFVTHLHGDHIFGIPGLLTSRSHHGVKTPLYVYGPKGIQSFIDNILATTEAHLGYDIYITEISDIVDTNESLSIIFEDDQFQISAGRVKHRIESFGYRIVEKDKLGKLDPVKIEQRGIKPGPVYGQLKQGIDVQLEDGSVLRATDYIGKSSPGKIIAIIGDTKYCETTIQIAKNADILVHEATFAADLQDLANKYGHSTSVDAAQIAKLANVGTLILTHFSSRYQKSGLEILSEEAKAIFTNTYLADDFWSILVSKN